MTELSIACETFNRLAEVALKPEESGKEWMRSIRLEIYKEKLLAVSTFGKVLAVEKLSDMPGASDFATCITVADDFLNFVRSGIVNDDVLMLTVAPGWTAARLASGPMYYQNADWPHADVWGAWRDLIPADLPKKALGVMSFNGEYISRIARSAPSGSFSCPKYVDPVQCLIVRDPEGPDWMGIFKVNKAGTDQSHEAATIPDWVR